MESRMEESAAGLYAGLLVSFSFIVFAVSFTFNFERAVQVPDINCASGSA
jgi:hypothetical protein